MKPLKRKEILSLLRRYLATGLESYKKKIIDEIPQKGQWYACQINGQHLAIQVSHANMIQIMESLLA